MDWTFGGALEQPDGALLTDDPFPHGRQSTARLGPCPRGAGLITILRHDAATPSAAVPRWRRRQGLEAEALPDDRPNALGDELRVVVPVDHDPAPIRTECAIGVAHRGVELGAGSFEAVTRRVAPGRRDRLVDVEHDDDVGLQATGRPAVQLVHPLDAESAADSLVRQ